MLALSLFQSCPSLFHPMDCSPWGSSVHGILQTRILQRKQNNIFQESILTLSILQNIMERSRTSEKQTKLWAGSQAQTKTYTYRTVKTMIAENSSVHGTGIHGTHTRLADLEVNSQNKKSFIKHTWLRTLCGPFKVKEMEICKTYLDTQNSLLKILMPKCSHW